MLAIWLKPYMPKWYNEKYKHITTGNKFGMFDYVR